MSRSKTCTLLISCRNNTQYRFDQIMWKQEEKRRIVRQLSKEMTLKNERPFSFYYRDKDKPKPVVDTGAEIIYEFKSNPIAW